MPSVTHFDRRALVDELGEEEGVPVGEADAPVAFVAADLVGSRGAVHADARAIEAHPDDSDRIVRSGREFEGGAAADAAFQNRFVPAEVRQQDIADDVPVAQRHGSLC